MWWFSLALAAEPELERPIPLAQVGVGLSAGLTDDGPGWLVAGPDGVTWVGGPGVTRALSATPVVAARSVDLDGDGVAELVGCGPDGLWVGDPGAPLALGDCVALVGDVAVVDGDVTDARRGVVVDAAGLVAPVLYSGPAGTGWGERGGDAWTVLSGGTRASFSLWGPLAGAAWAEGWWFASADGAVAPVIGDGLTTPTIPTSLGVGDVDGDGLADLVIGAADGVSIGLSGDWSWLDDVVAVAVGDADDDACAEVGVLSEGGAALVVVQAPCPADVDGDGWGFDDDCDDADPAVHPGAVEQCDGVDQDCDGQIDEWALRAPTPDPVDEGDAGAARAVVDGCASVVVTAAILDEGPARCVGAGTDTVRCTFSDQGEASVRFEAVGDDGLAKRADVTLTAVNTPPWWVGSLTLPRDGSLDVADHVADAGDDVVDVSLSGSASAADLRAGKLTWDPSEAFEVTLRLADEDGGAAFVVLTSAGDTAPVDDTGLFDDTGDDGPGCGETEPSGCDGCGGLLCLLSPGLLLGLFRRRP